MTSSIKDTVEQFEETVRHLADLNTVVVCGEALGRAQKLRQAMRVRLGIDDIRNYLQASFLYGEYQTGTNEVVRIGHQLNARVFDLIDDESESYRKECKRSHKEGVAAFAEQNPTCNTNQLKVAKGYLYDVADNHATVKDMSERLPPIKDRIGEALERMAPVTDQDVVRMNEIATGFEDMMRIWPDGTDPFQFEPGIFEAKNEMLKDALRTFAKIPYPAQIRCLHDGFIGEGQTIIRQKVNELSQELPEILQRHTGRPPTLQQTEDVLKELFFLGLNRDAFIRYAEVLLNGKPLGTETEK